jgi:2-polyprenyl-3-methyl-5-hydroxy-6-metoxy-1,4-benzoquinol methylase
MTSNEIARFIGNKPTLRSLVYSLIYITTLREWYIRSKLNKILFKNKDRFKLLDAGSGMGQHAIAVAKGHQHAIVAAFEKDDANVKDCNNFTAKRRIDNIAFFQGDLCDIQFDEEFDVILCGSVLEHIDDDVNILNRFYKALKDDGYVLIYVPSREQRILSSLRRKQQLIIRNSGKQYLHNHVRYYSPQELKNKLESIGFEIQDVTVTYGDFGALAYDIVTEVQYSAVFKYIFPLYLFLIHPLVLFLMVADFFKENRSGNGLMVVARKREK